VEVSPSQFTHEAEGLRRIRELLPDVEPFRAWSNFEFRDAHGRWHEVDLLVLGREQLYLIELKYYSGTLRGDDHRWQRDGHRAEDSPLLLAHRKAQYFATVLRQRLGDHVAEYGGPPGKAREIVPWVQEAVFLHHPSFRCALPAHCRAGLYGLDGHEDSSGLEPISELVLAPARGKPVSKKNSELLAGLMAKIGLVPRRQREVGNYVIDDEPLASGDGWQDWPAFHRVTTTNRYRIRFYVPDPEGTRADELALRRRVDYEYRLLERLHHDGLAVPRDLVQADLGIGLVYPTDERLRRLDLWLADHGGALPLEAQLDLVRQLAEAVSYAHRHRVVHRGLAPAAVSVRERAGGGRAAAVANWDAAARVPGTVNGARASGLPEAEDSPAVQAAAEEAPLFEAPEGRWASDADRVRLDVFAVGALAFYVLANQTLPAQDRGALVERLRRDSGLDLAAELPQVSAGLRELVRQATHPRPAERTPGMGAFLQQLEEAEAALWAPTVPEDVDPLEARPGVVLRGRYTYQRTLGSGSTAVGILVADTELGNAARVLKVAKDADAAERLAAEAAVLGPLEHERIATLIDHIDLGGRHALVLQYAGDATLAEELARRRGRLSLDLLERWGTDLLDALAALDHAGVTHRDIKPGNLGVPTPGKGRTETHLMLFDFSMAGAGPRLPSTRAPRATWTLSSARVGAPATTRPPSATPRRSCSTRWPPGSSRSMATTRTPTRQP
jgi:serine/threonine protein kinase